jgi:UDP-N-acetylmuramoyl-L-alanyl-D-glutamate--2,6-diaminopimelate ligase
VALEPDRRRAIASAIASAASGDVVLIAGKGHERYQEIAGVRHPFNDADIAAQCLALWPSMAKPQGGDAERAS